MLCIVLWLSALDTFTSSVQQPFDMVPEASFLQQQSGFASMLSREDLTIRPWQ